jgi:hypothetical protein
MPPKKEKITGGFNPAACAIPQLWCGESENPPKKLDDDTYYFKTGTRYECMKKGFGAGTHIERKNNLSPKSLQQIKYVGEKHEADFKKAGINSTDALVKEMRVKTSSEIASILKRILTKANGVLDTKAYNSTLLYLYKHGNGGLPACQKLY